MTDLKQSCTTRHVGITRKELPLSCPTSEMRTWDAHPRVYLPIEATGHAVCPYCSTEFTLIDHSE